MGRSSLLGTEVNCPHPHPGSAWPSTVSECGRQTWRQVLLASGIDSGQATPLSEPQSYPPYNGLPRGLPASRGLELETLSLRLDSSYQQHRKGAPVSPRPHLMAAGTHPALFLLATFLQKLPPFSCSEPRSQLRGLPWDAPSDRTPSFSFPFGPLSHLALVPSLGLWVAKQAGGGECHPHAFPLQRGTKA